MSHTTHTASGIPRTPIRFLLYCTKPYRLWAILAVVLVILAEAIGQGSYILFQWIVDSANAGELNKVILFCAAYPIALYLTQVLWRASGLAGMHWTNGVEAESADKLTKHLYQHGHTFFSDRFAGSLLSNVGNASHGGSDLIPQFLWTILASFISFATSFVLIMTVDVRTGMLFFVLLFVLVVLNIRLAPRKRELARVNATASTALRGTIIDILSNMSAVRQYASTHSEHERTREYIARKKTAGIVSWRYGERTMLINASVLFVFTALMLYTLTLRWSGGGITTGELILVLSLVTSLAGTLIFIGKAFNHTAQAMGEMSEGLVAILGPHDILDRDSSTVLQVPRGEVVIDKLSFTYKEQPVFADLNFTIQPGQRVGLVGPSGAGKTTLVSLLLRLHELQGGSIKIDGQNIAEVTQDSLRSAIAVVPQEPLLFHRTIRENIAYGKPDATDAEIEKVADMAQAHDFIKALPQGYDTLVGERGVKLSGGQRQRIAIARAMLKNAPILVLDEATSALDSESEVAIQKALHALMEGKTVLAIAHRLSTLREMDRIIVLENGTIVEDAPHEQLIKQSGTYARLWAHQAGGFIQE